MSYSITALSVQKNNPQRVNVYLDGEFAFGLARIVAAWLSVGQSIDDARIEQLKADDMLEVAYGRALRQIEHRPRTESEIRSHLQRHDTPNEVQSAVVERLKNAGLVDDAGFARIWVENRSDLRPRSRRALAYELRRRGVETDLIDQSLTAVDEDVMAYRAAQRRAERFKDLDWPNFRLKMFRFLAQRGFTYDTSQTAIARVWQDLNDNENNPEEEGYE